jgi:hypothetical protein
MTSRGRAQGQIIRNQAKLAGVIRKTLTAQMLKRANSQTRFIPWVLKFETLAFAKQLINIFLIRLNDAPSRINRGRSRSRSRSRSRNRAAQNTGSIQDRLGVRKGMSRMRRSFQNGAGQQQQQQQQQRGRSRSRSRPRLNRNNFKQQQQQQQQNAAPLRRRSNSVNARLGNNNNSSRPVRNRSRARNNSTQQNAGQIRRSGSVNGRLGTAAKGRAVGKQRFIQNQMNRPMTGRIVKRKVNRKVPVRKANAFGNAAARNVKKLQRWIS